MSGSDGAMPPASNPTPRPLPPNADLEHLRAQAKRLLRALRAGEAEALAEAAHYHPRCQDPGDALSLGGVKRTARRGEAFFRLADAQLIVARRYGEASWPRLRARVEALRMSTAQRRARFLLLATAPDAGPNHHAFLRAGELLTRHPDLATRDPWCAAVLGDVAGVERALRQDPDWARRRGGPRDWTPLLYLAFSPFHRPPHGSPEAFLDCARRLLAAGADPNASFTVADSPDAPLRPLYGACGVTNSPDLATLLLDHGALLDDGESLYHSLEFPDLRCFDLLLARGAKPMATNALPYAIRLGRSAAVARLLAHGADPNEAPGPGGTALHGAITDNAPLEVIRLLLEHGADPRRRRADGRDAARVAMQTGRSDVLACLEAWAATRTGATPQAGDPRAEADSPARAPLPTALEATPLERLLLACGSGDAAAAREVVQGDPDLFQRLDPADGAPALQWARTGRHEALAVLAEVGFPLSGVGPDGQTALHEACWHGQLECARVLLAAGLPVDCLEPTYGCTPLGWVAHGSDMAGRPEGPYLELVDLLLEHGADPTSMNRYGEGLISLAGGVGPVADRLRAAGAPEPAEAT